jgi:Domain of unknown function (DUF4190)
MGYPNQPQGQGEPGSPGSPWTPGQQPGGVGGDETQVPGGYGQPGGYQQQPGGYGQPGSYGQPSDYQPGGYGQPGGAGQPGGYQMPSYQQPGAYGQPGGYGQPGYQGNKTNTLATISLILGIGQILLGILAGIPAIIFGHMARRQIRQTGEQGAGMAMAGLILGYIGVALAIIGIIVIIALVSSSSTTFGQP